MHLNALFVFESFDSVREGVAALRLASTTTHKIIHVSSFWMMKANMLGTSWQKIRTNYKCSNDAKSACVYMRPLEPNPITILHTNSKLCRILRPKPCERWHFFHQQSHQQRRPWQSVRIHDMVGALACKPILYLVVFICLGRLSRLPAWLLRHHIYTAIQIYTVVLVYIGMIWSCSHACTVFEGLALSAPFGHASVTFRFLPPAVLQYLTAGKRTAELWGGAKKQEEDPIPAFQHQSRAVVTALPSSLARGQDKKSRFKVQVCPGKVDLTLEMPMHLDSPLCCGVRNAARASHI